MKAYNISIHERTEYMSHEEVFGRSARVPISSILPDDKGNESYSKYDYQLSIFAYSSEYSMLKHQH